MQLAIMTLDGPGVRSGTIFGLIDRERDVQLPLPVATKFHWVDFTRVDPARIQLSAEPQKAIAADGYYLFGSGADLIEIIGTQPIPTWDASSRPARSYHV